MEIPIGLCSREISILDEPPVVNQVLAHCLRIPDQVSPRRHVYLAAVEPQQGPQRIVPRAFHTFQEAQQWCNQQVQGATSA